MNYKESKKILAEIKKANNILLNCHKGPDPDSIGSALALYMVLIKMGKNVEIICPSEKLYEDVSFLKRYERIKKKINFTNFKFSEYDLFIALDSSNWDMVTSDQNIPLPSLPMVVIDHHYTNTRFGSINLVDEKASSVGEIINRIFVDWKIKLNKDIATAIMTAIVGDTGLFRYPNSTDKTFEAVQELLKSGADKELIIANMYRNNDLNLVRFWGEALSRVELDKNHKFVYSAVPYEVYEKYGKPENAKESSCDLFAQTTKGTEFGFMALEVEKNLLSISFRGRTDFDTSRMAKYLGGGGHKAASGAKIIGIPFDEAVEKVLRAARKFASKK